VTTNRELLPETEAASSVVATHMSLSQFASSIVESLLASQHYGECWGRYWLDLARYGDSDGYEGGPPPPYQICDAMPTPCFHVPVERMVLNT